MSHVRDQIDAMLDARFPIEQRATVVTHRCGPADNHDPERHEYRSLSAIARELALIAGCEYGGSYDPDLQYDGPLYFVPHDTLSASDAQALRIRSTRDLLGGVAQHAFIATKTITHPLVHAGAAAPAGWSARFPARVQNVVLRGFSAFCLQDARRAGLILLQQDGAVRLKLANASGGCGQAVARDADQLDAALARMPTEAIMRHGVVLEQNLTEVTTYSVGQVQAAGVCMSYYGTQRLTANHQGEQVYGGSDLVIVRGDFERVLGLELEPEVRLAVMQARQYDTVAHEEYPGLFASRRNYDVACGQDADGQKRCGVLEQSWRVGGATLAELPALKAFHASDQLELVRASSVEIYGECQPPSDAMVIFDGVDPRLGRLVKYGRITAYGNLR